MTNNPSCCVPEDSAKDAAILMRDNDTGVVPVIENEKSRRLVGIVTDRDLCNEVVAKARDAEEVLIEECMTRNTVSCASDDDLERVLELMAKNQIRRIPVVDQRNVIQGIVSLSDVVRRGQTKNGRTRETLIDIAQPTLEPSKPRAQPAHRGSN